jgi:hypothetical protein
MSRRSIPDLELSAYMLDSHGKPEIYHMKRLGSALPFAASTLLASIVLTGCGGFAGVAIPDTTSTPVTQPSVAGPLSGSVYGGHAPIVGAHVYVLEPGTTGYGSQATSDMYTAATGGGSAITKNTGDTGIPTSWYYVTTDTSGGFQLTGDYKCTAGNPVYLYAYGGTPSFPASSLATTNTFNIGGANGTAGTATEAFVSGGSITNVAIANGGNGYLDGTYNLTFTGGGGTGAAGTATATGVGGNITSITITKPGTGYTSSPTVTVNDINLLGTAATLTPTVSSTVDNIQFTVASSATNGVSSPPENFYVGETVTFSGLSGTVNSLVGTQGTVLATGLTTSTFEVQVTGGISSGSTSLAVSAGAIVIGTPANNPAVVNLAVLGVCPASGNFSSTSTTTLASGVSIPVTGLSYVYMNEVSTAATAYAFEGFEAPSATQNNATYIGSSATNLIGIQNAALNAEQLYDVQGSNVSTSYAGEGHIARSQTVSTYGVVPQALLDTLGNIIAACVDSNNTNATSTGTGTGVSPQCSTLFQTATQNGIPYPNTGYGTLPLDTAQALINIAKNPAGNSSYTASFMSNLFTLPTGNVPFTPNLTSTGYGQPNDFTVAIEIKSNRAGNVTGVESVQIDKWGNAWFDSLTTGSVFEMNPQGYFPTVSASLGSSTYSYVTIDTNNNVWVSNRQAKTPTNQGEPTGLLTEFIPTETLYGENTTTTVTHTFTGPANGFSYSVTTVAGANGNIYFGGVTPSTNNTIDNSSFSTLGVSSTGANLANFPVNAGVGTGVSIAHGAAGNANGGGYIWWTTENIAGQVALINPTTGAEVTHFPATTNIGSCQEPAVDVNGNLWCANSTDDATNENTLVKISPTSGTVTRVATSGLNNPFAVAIDGSNNVFVNNRGGSNITVYNTSGTLISPAAGYTPTATYDTTTLAPLNNAVDQSGNLWITSYDDNSVVIWIGAGIPAYNPLSVAASVNKLATAP